MSSRMCLSLSSDSLSDTSSIRAAYYLKYSICCLQWWNSHFDDMPTPILFIITNTNFPFNWNHRSLKYLHPFPIFSRSKQREMCEDSNKTEGSFTHFLSTLFQLQGNFLSRGWYPRAIGLIVTRYYNVAIASSAKGMRLHPCRSSSCHINKKINEARHV